MKRLNLFVLLLLIPFFVIGQSVKIKDGKVLVNKEPYCLVDDEKGFPKNFTIKALDGTALFSMKQEFVPANEQISYTYFTVTNLLDEEQFQIDQQLGNAIKLIVRKLYKYEVIVDNTISEDGLKKYKSKNADNFKEKYEFIAKRNNQAKPIGAAEQEEEATDKLTERDRNASISIIGKTIKQDFKVIGRYTKDSKATNGTIIETFMIYDVNNRLIARIEKEQFGKTITYVTKKDNRKRTITQKFTFDKDVIEAVVEELVEYLYL